MNGTNKLRPYESPDKGQSLQVQDIWYTLQGEGPFSGTPAIFVRLTGCNLACTFCDTQWDDEQDRVLPVLSHQPNVDEQKGICELIFDIRCEANDHPNLVVLTGGEPCRQDLSILIPKLTDEGYQVQIETAGTYWQECLNDPSVTIVCSPKTQHVHPKIMEYCNHWKYVIQSDKIDLADGLPSWCTQIPPRELWTIGDLESQGHKISKYGEPARPPDRKGITVWLSPCDEGSGREAETKQNHLKVGSLCLQFGYRATIQLHKVLELP